MAKKNSVKNTKSDSFKKNIETISTTINDHLLKLNVSGSDINDVLNSLAYVKDPSRQKTLEELENEELDEMGRPETYNKLSDKVKALFFLRCNTSPNYGTAEPNKNDSVMVKQLCAYMEMLVDADRTDLVMFGDSVTYCPIPKLGKGFANMMRETARKFALDGFIDTCKTIGLVMDPNHDEFKAYPKYLQKWLHKFVLGTKAKK